MVKLVAPTSTYLLLTDSGINHSYWQRASLYYAKSVVESNFAGAEVIYGDTDSYFYQLPYQRQNSYHS